LPESATLSRGIKWQTHYLY